MVDVIELLLFEVFNLKILIVDDEKIIRDVVEAYLIKSGYECRSTSSGSEALEVQKSFKADVLISDIRMPGMSGIDLARKIYDKYAIPVVLMSGYSAPKDMERIKDIEYYFYAKPIKVKEIKEKISEIEKMEAKKETKEDLLEVDDEYIEMDDELLQEFLTEGYDMLDDVEPRLLDIADKVVVRECWNLKECGRNSCPLYENLNTVPCWKMPAGATCRNEEVEEGELNPVCLECEIYSDRHVDREEVDTVFRVFHSFKGSSSFLGFDNITNITHEAETLLDFIRREEIIILPVHIDLLMKSVDVLRYSMKAINDPSYTEQSESAGVEVIEELKKVIHKSENELFVDKISSSSNKGVEVVEEQQGEVITEDDDELPDFDISDEIKEKFIQESVELIESIEGSLLKLEENPSDTVNLANAFRNIHSFKGNAGFLGYSDIEKLSHKMESVLESFLSADFKIDKKKIPVLLDMLDLIQGGLISLSSEGDGSIPGLNAIMASLNSELGIEDENLIPDKTGKSPMQIEMEKSQLKEKQKVVEQPVMEDVIEIVEKKEVDVPEKVKIVAPPPKKKVVEKKKNVSSAVSKIKKSKEIKRTDIRVDLDKLDSLLDLVGELVIAGSMVTSNEEIIEKGVEGFEKSSENLTRIIRELQQVAMSVRMIPIAGVFSKMMRLVHDLSRKSHKKVKLITAGEQTEVDKTVIEMISDPLVHIIRNAVDHGLESEEERQNSGKDLTGTVFLEARHEGGEVWIIIKDDGKGLNRDAILKKGIERGLVEGDGSNMKDEDVFSLVFEPGFSTASQVTEISGRGVGMDVVKKNIEKLKGTIDIRSEAGKGSAFILRIPLTLAIIDGMLVRVGDAKYVIPILAIKESLKVVKEQITISPEGGEIIKVRDELFPVIRLHALHDIEPDSREITETILMLVEYKGRFVALMIDELLGQESIVVKGLSEYIGNVKGVSGCSILGSGDICLILDIGTLLQLAEDKLI